MEQWVYAIIATIVCFAVIKYSSSNKNKNEYNTMKNNELSLQDGVLFMFMLLIFVALTYWFNIGGTNPAMKTSKDIMDTIGGFNKEYERVMVNNIRQDVNVSYEPF